MYGRTAKNRTRAMPKTKKESCEISSSQEAQNLLGCTAAFLIECRPDDGGSTHL
jgi:hypothetical protein